MDLKTLKLEAITRTAFNLADYSHARRDVSGKKRIIHVSVKGSQDKTVYYNYAIKMVNRNTVNLTCSHSKAERHNKRIFQT